MCRIAYLFTQNKYFLTNLMLNFIQVKFIFSQNLISCGFQIFYFVLFLLPKFYDNIVSGNFKRGSWL